MISIDRTEKQSFITSRNRPKASSFEMVNFSLIFEARGERRMEGGGTGRVGFERCRGPEAIQPIQPPIQQVVHGLSPTSSARRPPLVLLLRPKEP